jgi:hypothetical protein
MAKRIMLVAFTTVVVVFAGMAARRLATFEEPAVDPAWELRPSPDIPDGSLTGRYTGTSTLLFSDGETDWRVDDWFMRFGPLEFLKGKEARHPELQFSTLPRFDEIILFRAS